jgi:hypothetical protein
MPDMGEGLADLDRVRTTGDLGEALRRLRRLPDAAVHPN